MLFLGIDSSERALANPKEHEQQVIPSQQNVFDPKAQKGSGNTRPGNYHSLRILGEIVSLQWHHAVMTTRAVAFLATSNPSMSLRFYRDIVGIPLLEDTPFALVFDVDGTVLRIQKAERVVEAPYTSFGLEVDDIESEVQRLQRAGVTFVRYPHFEQDELNIWTAPGGARVAWFKDPDGNLLSLSMHDAQS